MGTSSTAVAAGAAKSTCYPPRSLVRLNTKVKRVMRQQQRSTFPCSCLLLLFFFFSAVFLVVVEGHRPHAAFSNTRESRIKIEEQDKGEVLVMPSLDQKRPDHQDIAKWPATSSTTTCGESWEPTVETGKDCLGQTLLTCQTGQFATRRVVCSFT